MNDINFLAAGYLYKKIVQKLDWMDADIVDVCSVSSCISASFADYIDYWLHNGYWLFDKPCLMEKIANKERIDLSNMRLFYYEVYNKQFDYLDDKTIDYGWNTFEKEVIEFPTDVLIPKRKLLMGFDIVTFFCGNAPECSPLSCNNIASDILMNKHCLFNSFIEAKQALEQGLFKNTEPGPYRIFAVYEVLVVKD